MDRHAANQVMSEWLARTEMSEPFLRWAGGKRPFLYKHSDRIPEFEGKYIEPFLGSGSMLFFLTRRSKRFLNARLGDVNLHLVRCFQEVRDHPEKVHEDLTVLQLAYSRASDKSEFYYSVREAHNDAHPKTSAARFIFLNRTCWNGLYRVNQRGHFNVPYGAPKSDQVIPSLEDLLNASAALTASQIRATSWENTLAFAEPGDFVFLDPPYYSDLTQERGQKYSKVGFGLAGHERLAERLNELSSRGVDFMLTNSGESEMVKLYSDHGLNVETVFVPRSINSKIDKRVPAPELIVTPGNSEKSTGKSALALAAAKARRR